MNRVIYERTIAGVTERWECEGDTIGEALEGLGRMLPKPRHAERREVERALRKLQEPAGVDAA